MKTYEWEEPAPTGYYWMKVAEDVYSDGRIDWPAYWRMVFVVKPTDHSPRMFLSSGNPGAAVLERPKRAWMLHGPIPYPDTDDNTP